MRALHFLAQRTVDFLRVAVAPASSLFDLTSRIALQMQMYMGHLSSPR